MIVLSRLLWLFLTLNPSQFLIDLLNFTFGIEADSVRTAKPKLERIETDILNIFKTLGVRTEPLSGYERL